MLTLFADPWLKSPELEGAKEASVRPSRPSAKTMPGSEQEPKFSAPFCRVTLLHRFALALALDLTPLLRRALAACEACALHSASCSPHCPVPPSSSPEFAALEHALFCTEQERSRAEPRSWKVAPLTSKGRSAFPLSVTCGAAPPRAPENDWRFPPALFWRATRAEASPGLC